MDVNIDEIISEIQDRWLDIEGVDGVWPGKQNDKDCIEVHVRIRTPNIEKKIPAKYKGFPVNIIEGGPINIQ